MEEIDSPDSGEQTEDRQVVLQKIYLRDASVEVPNAPQVFTREWQPQVDVDLNTSVEDLGEGYAHVVLTATVTAKQDSDVAYIVEAQQAGVFHLSGFEELDEQRQVLGAYCPGILFPYLRAVVDDCVTRAGFPQFLLQPVNFEALFEYHADEEQGYVSERRH